MDDGTGLPDLRQEIDKIDKELLLLFQKRMDICCQVADYKIKNNLPVFQANRELEVIERVKNAVPDELSQGVALLFGTIMDISKAIQSERFSLSQDAFILSEYNDKDTKKIIGCQGIAGSYQEKAVKKLFGTETIPIFYPSFQDVFDALESKEIDYAVLPARNSTAGTVENVYDLMKQRPVYICDGIDMPVDHCLAVSPLVNNINDIDIVYSHEQALSQCAWFLRSNSLASEALPNTAIAAKRCADQQQPIAAICSNDCAEMYGLKVLAQNISDVLPNVTRFICIGRELSIHRPDEKQVVSLILTLENQPGVLWKTLTRFSAASLDLLHIESRPARNGTFDTTFYLDFSGDIRKPKVAALLQGLARELKGFKLLGQYSYTPLT